MSIQTELSRIINAKSAIKAAIDGKGVTVPDTTLLDGMAALIESIEAGGGDLTIDGRPVAWGVLTPAENITSQITLLGSKDSPWLKVGNSTSNRSRLTAGYIIRLPGTLSPTVSTLLVGSSGPTQWNGSNNSHGGSVFYRSSSGNYSSKRYETLMELNYGDLILNLDTTFPLVAGYSYFWLAVQIIMPEDIA